MESNSIFSKLRLSVYFLIFSNLLIIFSVILFNSSFENVLLIFIFETILIFVLLLFKIIYLLLFKKFYLFIYDKEFNRSIKGLLLGLNLILFFIFIPSFILQDVVIDWLYFFIDNYMTANFWVLYLPILISHLVSLFSNFFGRYSKLNNLNHIDYEDFLVQIEKFRNRFGVLFSTCAIGLFVIALIQNFNLQTNSFWYVLIFCIIKMYYDYQSHVFENFVKSPLK